MWNTKNLLVCGLVLSLIMACSPKNRDKTESPTTPPPAPAPSPMVMPTVMPVSPGVPFSDKLDDQFSAFRVEDEELKKITDYDPKNIENLNKTDGPLKRFTGFKDNDGNSYTDAASDLLITFLRKHAQTEQKSGGDFFDNLKLADSIREVKVQSLNSNKVVIGLQLLSSAIDEDDDRDQKSPTKDQDRDQKLPDQKQPEQKIPDQKGDKYSGNFKNRSLSLGKSSSTKKTISEITLSGHFNDRAAKLRVTNSKKKSDLIESAELRCLDLDDSTCETSVLRITAKNGAVADVVLRNTIADLSIKMNEKQNTLSNNFKSIRRMFYNSLYRTELDQPIIEKTVFNSFAVVNGRSGLVIKLIMDKAEALLFKAPLISTSSNNSEVNIDMKHNIKAGDLTDEEMQKSRNEANISYTDMIDEAKLSRNNGLGQVQITLKLNGQSALAGNQDPIFLKVLRIVKPIVNLDEDTFVFGSDN
jgi:hypothetical protein